MVNLKRLLFEKTLEAESILDYQEDARVSEHWHARYLVFMELISEAGLEEEYYAWKRKPVLMWFLLALVSLAFLSLVFVLLKYELHVV